MSRSASVSPDSFTSFGDLLKYLRRRAQLTQRDLSIAVGYSEPQISYLETNRRLPDVATVAARFVPALDLRDEPALARRLVELAQVARREADPAPGDPPFKGLQYFEEADAGLFFGREDLTARLVARLIPASTNRAGDEIRFLAVVGASGSGKSSVLRAGLVPALRRHRDTAPWQMCVITPTAHPMQSLADRAQNATLLVVDQFEELFTLCSDEAERRAFVDSLLEAAGAPRSGERAGQFPVWVVIALRADFYAECSQYADLRQALSQHQEYIGPMNTAELRRAIQEPAKAAGWEFEPGLVDLVLRDTGQEPGALPLLSHALLETWTRRRGHTLTVGGYLASGGVRGAIAETAETLFNDELDPSQRAIARNIFLRLTELGEGAQAARRRATLTELVLRPEDESQVDSVLNRLANARLITTSAGTAELAHEALIREWPTLRHWLEEDRESILLHRQLATAAQTWDSGGRSPDELYRGARLARSVEWAAAHAEEVNVLERAFLEASGQQAERHAAEREAQRLRELAAAQALAEAEKQRAEDSMRSAKKLRQRAYGLAGALALVLGLLGVAFYLGNQARTSAATAQQNAALANANAKKAEAEGRIATARELAAAAAGNLNVDPERSILLALQAVAATAPDKTVLPEAAAALHGAVQASRARHTLQGHTSGVWSVAVNAEGTRAATTSEDGTARVWDLATGKELLSLPTIHPLNTTGTGAVFTPDGTHLLTVSDGNMATLWDLKTGRPALTLSGHTDAVNSVAISPDGRIFATASADKTARLWDAASGKELLTLTGHPGAVGAIAFAPDGRRIYTGSDEDGTAIAWDAETGKQLFSFSGQSATTGVEAIAVSPDSKRVATGEFDTTVRIWDDTGKLLQTLFGHSSLVVSVAFSPDGRYIASGSEDGVAKIWDAATGQEVLRLAGHTSGVMGLAFAPDGSQLVTSSRDGTAKVWDVSPGGSREWLTIAGHGGLVTSVAYSPDGTRLASWGRDGAARVWDARDGKKLLTIEHEPDEGNGGNVAYSPDGKRLALVSGNAVKIVDAGSGAELLTLPPFDAPAISVAFSPDGHRLAMASVDGKLRIYDSVSGTLLSEIPAHKDAIQQLAFSPDGTRLATASSDGTAKLWGAVGGKELLTFNNGVRISGIGFSPDGKRVATSSNDGTVKVWDAVTGAIYLTLTGHTGATFGVAFSPDGKQLATTSVDRTVKVWTLPGAGERLAEPLTLLGHTGAVYRAAFSPDGRRLATASRDGTTRVYALPVEDLIGIARSRLTRALTTDECQKFLHLQQCPPPS